MRIMRGKFFVILVVFLLLLCPAAFATEPAADLSAERTENFLDQYVEILRQIQDERTTIMEMRRDQELDDKMIDAFAALIDKSMARLEAEGKRLEAERVWIEREQEKLIRTAQTPARIVTVNDPLIDADLREKIWRYWGN